MARSKKNYYRKFFLLMISGILMLAFQNCSSSGFDSTKIYNGDGSGLVYYSDSGLQQQSMAILQTSCASCHGGGVSLGGLGQVTDVSHLITYKYILPGNGSGSLLVQMMDNGTMPPSGALSASNRDTVRAWINSFTVVGEEPPSDPGMIPLRATFTSINTHILNRCVACHSPTGVRPQEDFSSFASVMASGQVVPGSSATSALYQSTLDYSMPKDPYAKLSYAELAVLKTWIDSGAAND